MRGAFEPGGLANCVDELVRRGKRHVAALEREATDGVSAEHGRRQDELTVEAVLGIEAAEQRPAVIIVESDEGRGEVAAIIDDDGEHAVAGGPQAARRHYDTSGT